MLASRSSARAYVCLCGVVPDEVGSTVAVEIAGRDQPATEGRSSNGAVRHEAGAVHQPRGTSLPVLALYQMMSESAVAVEIAGRDHLPLQGR